MVRTIWTAHSTIAGCAAAKPCVNQRAGAVAAMGSRPFVRTITPRWRNSSAVPNLGDAATSPREAIRSGWRSASSSPIAPPMEQPA